MAIDHRPKGTFDLEHGAADIGVFGPLVVWHEVGDLVHKFLFHQHIAKHVHYKVPDSVEIACPCLDLITTVQERDAHSAIAPYARPSLSR